MVANIELSKLHIKRMGKKTGFLNIYLSILLRLWLHRSDAGNFYNCVFSFVKTCLYFGGIKFANLVLGVEAIFQLCFVRLPVAHLSDFQKDRHKIAVFSSMSLTMIKSTVKQATD